MNRGWTGLALGALGALILAAEVVAAEPELQHPIWAYAVQLTPNVPGPAEDGKLYDLPGSPRHFTWTQAHNERAPKDPPGVADWYPQDHPAMPKIVAEGDVTRNIRPCALCHLPNGKGRPENAPVAGLPRDYILEQLHDMKAGARHSAEPRKANTALMADYAKAMTEEEMAQSADYFSAMPWTAWIKVVETKTVPKVRSAIGLYVPLTGAEAGQEPIGRRIIETPLDVERSEGMRDPRAPFLAYVPVGAVAAGKKLVAGAALPCATCHGPSLEGVGAIPGIAGRSPSYIARQLTDFQKGARHGTMATLMEPVVAGLSEDDVLNISAYVASMPQKAPVFR